MNRIPVLALAVLALAFCAGGARASWEETSYSGCQPWYNIFAKRSQCQTPEEERLQKFWHDYYDAMKNYYGALDHIDWVAYYKNHGYQVNEGCGPCGCPGQRINYAPVFATPSMQWAVPTGPSCQNGAAGVAPPSQNGAAGVGPPVISGIPVYSPGHR